MAIPHSVVQLPYFRLHLEVVLLMWNRLTLVICLIEKKINCHHNYNEIRFTSRHVIYIENMYAFEIIEYCTY